MNRCLQKACEILGKDKCLMRFQDARNLSRSDSKTTLAVLLFLSLWAEFQILILLLSVQINVLCVILIFIISTIYI